MSHPSWNSKRRLRAHSNPLNDDLPHPSHPNEVKWENIFKKFKPISSSTSQNHKINNDNDNYENKMIDDNDKDNHSSSSLSSSSSHSPLPPFPSPFIDVKIADVGCGFGGLLFALAPHFPNIPILGMEIRERVVDIDNNKITKIQKWIEDGRGGECPFTFPIALSPTHSYQNISVLHTNIQKLCPFYFRQGQLNKMFILFPDPHFKRSNHRRRVVNSQFCDLYAYCIEEGGMLYTITDVKDLHEWMVLHLSHHPLFETVDIEKELGSDDVCIEAMTNQTEEGQKVARLGGSKYPAVFRRIKRKEKELK